MAKSPTWFFHNILQKNLKEIFGPLNTRVWTSPLLKKREHSSDVFRSCDVLSVVFSVYFFSPMCFILLYEMKFKTKNFYEFLKFHSILGFLICFSSVTFILITNSWWAWKCNFSSFKHLLGIESKTLHYIFNHFAGILVFINKLKFASWSDSSEIVWFSKMLYKTLIQVKLLPFTPVFGNVLHWGSCLYIYSDLMKFMWIWVKRFPFN